MGRPRMHDERTAIALLDTAERLADTEGIEALTVRRLAAEAGTTSRAVYSLFGSMSGVLVGLGNRAFSLLRDVIDAIPLTDDPVHDVVAAGAVGFRRFVIDHPVLFAVAIQRIDVAPTIRAGVAGSASDAWLPLHARLERLPAGHLRDRSVPDAAIEFHAACEGLAGIELRFHQLDRVPEIWLDTLRSLVLGWAQSDRCRSTEPRTAHRR